MGDHVSVFAQPHQGLQEKMTFWIIWCDSSFPHVITAVNLSRLSGEFRGGILSMRVWITHGAQCKLTLLFLQCKHLAASQQNWRKSTYTDVGKENKVFQLNFSADFCTGFLISSAYSCSFSYKFTFCFSFRHTSYLKSQSFCFSNSSRGVSICS